MKLGLAFSGGKDSWACLWLNLHRLDEITVFWVDTGKNYPELIETVNRARQMCKNFVVVPANRDAQNAEKGVPSEIVPIKWTREGQLFSGKKPVMVQSYLQCCYENISVPLFAAVKAAGVTHLIRGQRDDEGHTSPSKSGDSHDGVTFLHPIADWSREQVLAYVGSKMEMPEHFALAHSSMDCYDCTAFRADSRDRVEFTRKRYPERYAEYLNRMAKVNFALAAAAREGV